MQSLDSELKRVLKQVKTAKAQVRSVVKDGVGEARKYATSRRKEIEKLMRSDMQKVKRFVSKEQKELEKIQRKIDQFQRTLPAEIKIIRSYLNRQKSEAERLVKRMRAAAKTNARKVAKKSSSKRTTSKSGTRKKKRSTSARR